MRALIALWLAVGCAQNVTLVFDPGLPGCPETTGDPVLLEDLAEAREAWAAVGVMPTVCVADISFAPAGEVGAACGFPDKLVHGCSKAPSMRILVAEGLDAERRQTVVTHELGHFLHAGTGHLQCLDVPGDDIMCPSGGPSAPTERDGAFVRGELDAETIGYR